METTRSTFLKLVAATSASALVPFRLIKNTTPLLEGEQWIAQIRETNTYVIEKDLWIQRYDIRSNEESWTQISVEFQLNTSEPIDSYRETALQMLLEQMEKDGIDPNNLVTLPELS